MDEYKEVVTELLRLNQVMPALGNQRRLAHAASVDSLLMKTLTTQSAFRVDQYSQVTAVKHGSQLLADSTENMAVGTVVRRDEWQDLEQERQKMLRRQGDLERSELAVQQRQGEVARDEHQLREREAECDKWERAVRQNRTVLQKEVDRRKDEWRGETERREKEWQQVLKEREAEAE